MDNRLGRQFPARIHVLLARDAPLGVVIRRGPTKRVCTVLWDRKTDTFHMGQWLKGRIYERRSDLSPDGKYLIYFALNGKWQAETRGAWTAVSVAPYLKAIVLLAKGDTWHGGGLFTGNNQYWLNDGAGHKLLRDSRQVQRDLKFRPREHFGGECPGVYYLRLQRDGWIYMGKQENVRPREIHLFEKELGNGWILRRLAHAEIGARAGKGAYWDEHALYETVSGVEIPCPDWEWADIDGRRLVWAMQGQLYTGVPRNQIIASQQMLYDFNEMSFEEIVAP
jgi:hypothetical protein